MNIYIVSSGLAETIYARGYLNLTKRQIVEISTNQSVVLSPAQAQEFEAGISSGSPEWLLPLEAVHWLSPHVGGDANAKLAIAERIKDGAIKCAIAWLCESLDSGPLPDRRPMVTSDRIGPGTAFWIAPSTPKPRESILGGAFGGYSDDWERDVKRWNWMAGTLVSGNSNGRKIKIISGDGEQSKKALPTRQVAFGARFYRADVERIVHPTTFSNSLLEDVATAMQSKRGKKGPRQKKYNAAPVLARLEAEIANGGIRRLGSVTDYGVQSALEREIAEEMSNGSDRQPSESTIRRWAKKLMVAWREVSGVQ